MGSYSLIGQKASGVFWLLSKPQHSGRILACLPASLVFLVTTFDPKWRVAVMGSWSDFFQSGLAVAVSALQFRSLHVAYPRTHTEWISCQDPGLAQVRLIVIIQYIRNFSNFQRSPFVNALWSEAADFFCRLQSGVTNISNMYLSMKHVNDTATRCSCCIPIWYLYNYWFNLFWQERRCTLLYLLYRSAVLRGVGLVFYILLCHNDDMGDAHRGDR